MRSTHHLLVRIGLAVLAVGVLSVATGLPHRWTATAAKAGVTTTGATAAAAKPTAGRASDTSGRVVRSDAEWKRLLTPEQYRILRRGGTEIAFTGRYWNSHESGIYRCAGCGNPLFDSKTKFESGTGWPSFWAPLAPGHIRELKDRSFGIERVEVRCARCDGHLGHVFDDGPRPTGLRYCINSGALDFVARR